MENSGPVSALSEKNIGSRDRGNRFGVALPETRCRIASIRWVTKKGVFPMTEEAIGRAVCLLSERVYTVRVWDTGSGAGGGRVVPYRFSIGPAKRGGNRVGRAVCRSVA